MNTLKIRQNCEINPHVRICRGTFKNDSIYRANVGDVTSETVLDVSGKVERGYVCYMDIGVIKRAPESP